MLVVLMILMGLTFAAGAFAAVLVMHGAARLPW